MAGVVLSVVGKYDGKDLLRAQKALEKLKQEAQRASSPFTRMGDALAKSGQKIADTGKSLTRNVTLPLAGLAYGAKKAIDAASDLAETQSKVGQIFGDSAPQIEKFAATAATALGQSKQQAMDAASTFAIFGKSAGLSGSNLVGFSTELTTLATDLASFNNTSPEEAITAIGAALRGENEPIRRFGVLLDDASLRQEALRQGLVKTTKQALTPQQKVLAAQALIMKQTTTAQGDFARTSDGLANQQRILKAQFANTSAELGQAFLPIALTVASVVKDKIIPAIQKLANFFNGLSPTTKTAIVGFVAAAAALGPLLTIVGNVTKFFGLMSKAVAFAGMVQKAFAGEAVASAAAQKIAAAATKVWTVVQGAFNAVMAANPIVLVTLAIAALVAGVIIAYKKFKPFRDFVDGTFRVIKNAAIGLFNWVKQNWPLLLGILTGPIGLAVVLIAKNWDTIKNATAAAFDWIRGKVTTVVSNVIDFVKSIPGKIAEVPKKMLEFGKNLVEGIWDGITSMGSWFKDKITGWISDHVPGVLKNVLGIASPSKVTARIGEEVANGVATGMLSRAEAVRKASKYVADTAVRELSAAQLHNYMGPVANREVFTQGVPWDTTFTTSSSGIDKAAEAFRRLKDAANSALDTIKSKAQTVIDFAKNISSSLMDFGAVTSFDTSTDRGVTAQGVLANMGTRLEAIKKFGSQLGELRKLGLNNTSLQEIIAAGPEAGSQIAAALIAAGKDAITGPGGVNDLENQLRFFSNAVGDIGTRSQYGMDTATARGVMQTTVTVSEKAVVINVGDNVDSATAERLRTTIQKEVRTAIKDLGVAVTTSKKSSRSR